MLRVKSDRSVDKSDWLRVRNESTAHVQKIGPGQKSRFLMLTKKERGLLGRECIEIYFDLYLGEKGSMYFRSRPATSVHALQLPFAACNFRPRSTTSVHGLQLPSTLYNIRSRSTTSAFSIPFHSWMSSKGKRQYQLRQRPQYAGENAALFLRLGIPSTLIRHKNGVFWKRSSNWFMCGRKTFRQRTFGSTTM